MSKQKQITQKAIMPYNTNKLEISPELKEVQQLMPISAVDYDQLKRDISESGEIRDPIKVYRDKSGKHLIVGGANRWNIAQELGWSTVPIEIVEIKGSSKIQDLAIKDNLSRRHLSNDQKRKLIAYFLKSDPEQSNKSVAKKSGSTKETVKTVRANLESGGEIRPVKTVKGADDKTYKKPVPISKPKKSEKSGGEIRPLEKDIDAEYDLNQHFLTIVKDILQGKDKQDRELLINSMIDYLESIK